MNVYPDSSRSTGSFALIRLISALIKIGLCSAVIISTSGCTKEPIEIGCIATISGTDSFMGVSANNAILIAVDEVNQEGGINKRQIKIHIRDDFQNEATALRVMQELHNSGIEYYITSVKSQIMTSLFSYINDEKLLTIAPSTTGNAFSGYDDYLIKLYPDNRAIGESIANFITSMGYKKIGILYDGGNLAYSITLLDSFAAGLTSTDASIVYKNEFTRDESHSAYSKEILGLMESQPDAVFFICNSYHGAMMSQELYRLGIDVPRFFPSWAMSNEFLRLGGSAVEGSYLVTTWDLDSRIPEFLKFKKEYSRRFGEDPVYSSFLAYESLMVMAEAMRKADLNDTESVRNQIVTAAKSAGLQGPIYIDEFGDNSRELIKYIVEEGEFVRF